MEEAITSKHNMGESISLALTPGVEKIASASAMLADKLGHDKEITEGDLEALSVSLENLSIDVCGDAISLQEVLAVDNFKAQLAVLQALEDGADNLLGDTIEFLPLRVAEIMSKQKRNFHFAKLKKISDKAVEMFSHHEGGLSFSEIKNFSDQSLLYLSQNKGRLYLGALASLSEMGAFYLSKHEGGELLLFGIHEMSDEALKHLGRYKGDLNLNGLQDLSLKGAEYLGHHEGRLWLGNLDLTDDMVRALCAHKEEIRFQNNAKISDEGVRLFAESECKVDIPNFNGRIENIRSQKHKPNQEKKKSILSWFRKK